MVIFNSYVKLPEGTNFGAPMCLASHVAAGLAPATAVVPENLGRPGGQRTVQDATWSRRAIRVWPHHEGFLL